MNGYIYKITNKINGKIYIGQHNGKNPKYFGSGILLNPAIKKYGKNNFEREILEYHNNYDDLNDREEELIKYYNCRVPNGYNLRAGGNNSGHHEITRKKMSESHTGVPKGPMSEKTKKRISESQLNRDKTQSIKKRKETMLLKDSNIFEKIGRKSSETQKKNGLNKGLNNPNANKNDLEIFDSNGNVMYTTKIIYLSELCTNHNLPIRALIKSYQSDGEYKLYEKAKPRNIEFLKYKGWYCKLKNK